jgi:hypothetical protein
VRIVAVVCVVFVYSCWWACSAVWPFGQHVNKQQLNRLNAELNPICHLLALLRVHHFLHVSRIRVKSLTLRLLMSYTG